MDTPQEYPFFVHKIYSFLPKRFESYYERFSSALSDSIYAVASFFISYFFFCTFGIKDCILASFVVALLVSVSIGQLKINEGPRAYHLTPRTVSQLFFMLFVSFALMYKIDNSLGFLFLSLLFGMACSYSSIFGNQALLFFISTALLFGFYEPILIYLVAIVLNSVLSHGKSITLLWSQIKSSIYYYKVQKRLEANYTRQRNEYFVRFKKSIQNGKFFEWLYNDEYKMHIFVFGYLQIMLSGLLYIFFHSLNVPILLFIPIIFSIFAFFITYLPPFRFLGEPERYLEFGIFFQYFIFIFFVVASRQYWLIVFLFCYSLVGYYFFVKLFRTRFARSERIYNSLLPLIEKVDFDGKTIFSLGDFSWAILYKIKRAKLLYGLVSYDEDRFSTKEFDFLCGNYPLPNASLSDIDARYSIDYIVTERFILDLHDRRWGKELDNNMFAEIVEESDDFLIYKVFRESIGAKNE